jgi:hypothetical protein
MLQHNIRHLLVVDKINLTNAKPIGIVTPLDFTRYHELTNDSVVNDAIEKLFENYRQIYRGVT